MKVAFLDRDGVINKEVNYLYRIEDFEYTNGCIEGLKGLQSLGFKLIIITNQAGIARGYYNEQDYYKLTQWMLNDLKVKGVDILDVFHCPHHPEGRVKELAISCDCRKPKPGMIIEATSKYNISLKDSILIGDKKSDIVAGKAAGIPRCYLVRTGHEHLMGKTECDVVDNLISVVKEL